MVLVSRSGTDRIDYPWCTRKERNFAERIAA